MIEAASDSSSGKGKSRTRLIVGLVAVAVVVAAGIAVLVLTGRSDADSAATSKPSASAKTATVVKTDLADTKPTAGTLGFGAEQPVKGTKPGMITWLPGSGETLTRGSTLYRVDDKPVPIFHGDLPLFRTLGMPQAPPPPPPPAEGQPPPPPAEIPAPPRGRDVKLVAENLKALGYTVGKLSAKDDPQWTPALSAAVKRWQKDVGLPQTGTLDVGDVAVLPGDVRVGGVTARLGDAAEGELMTVTSTAKVVTVSMAATEVGSLAKGSAVTVVLPDSRQVPGKVSDISRTTTTEKSPGDNAPPKITVTVTLDDPAAVANLDSAGVQVKFVSDSRTGVLAVPVTALVALREGGYAVQTPQGKYVPVRTGLFAMGQVEISGPGVAEGMQVLVAA